MSAVLNALFETHRRSLFWSVMRIVQDAQIAEDVAQETYIRVRNAAENGSIEHMEAYLHQTAKNLALDYLRRKNTRRVIETEGIQDTEINNIPHNAPSVEQVIMDRQKLCHFKDALSRLPERAQTVMVLSRIEDWPNNRIAEHLGISERTVFNDLKLAMAHCREALIREDRS